MEPMEIAIAVGVALVVLVVLAALLQRRRRSGGVIAADTSSPARSRTRSRKRR